MIRKQNDKNDLVFNVFKTNEYETHRTFFSVNNSASGFYFFYFILLDVIYYFKFKRYILKKLKSETLVLLFDI